ncbi:L-rhamnose mutarotase [Niallia nealsonii]|uniref:L-rhamnose mutarotase n=1 Tax=Niallia nealsonii TaxID=115979 RepID=A0A2N0Z5N8_9BACI|nr:L-rhamnose mutarotase [Niallia nealsonii]PKG24821.1 L-rhamnose mutarotase [Niallia nealsonii]
MSVTRIASVMSVYKDQYEEYKRRHDELWPEMKAELKAHGVHNYSIFLDEASGRLFAYLEIESEEKWSKMSETAICRKWWDYMEPLMETNPDNSPVSTELKNVFYLA